VAGPGDLFETANDLLLAAAEALDTVPDLLGTGFLGAPTRQFVAPGNPVHDCCEQLAVWVNPVGAGARSPGTLAPDFMLARPTFRVEATRCIPQGKIVAKQYVPPLASALTASAEQHLADGWALWNHIFNLVNADLLFQKCLDMVQWNMTVITPSGGCVGWALTFVVGVDGYREVLTT
jgi:hypothetical protein